MLVHTIGGSDIEYRSSGRLRGAVGDLTRQRDRINLLLLEH
jgi:hypothetical protein